MILQEWRQGIPLADFGSYYFHQLVICKVPDTTEKTDLLYSYFFPPASHLYTSTGNKEGGPIASNYYSQGSSNTALTLASILTS